ncbi:MAG: hypothetical protein OZSIB_1516 [Candidatus Ozemobacter sibiricus]|uniref:Uncharacterized protein n=1 Tax=Candidatus Ozemobacter sibiricus TaxID=2268124 RepID=A0A367ZJV7_9BACT|nr:MAG: hypothetical protein OZSIB_1516 [Candidatus Ozemobacter sibiricus]
MGLGRPSQLTTWEHRQQKACHQPQEQAETRQSAESCAQGRGEARTGSVHPEIMIPKGRIL